VRGRCAPVHESARMTGTYSIEAWCDVAPIEIDR
jgi:hypothetical protein